MSKSVAFKWQLPEGVFDDDFKEDDLRTRVQEGVALSLFKEGKVTSGYAAEMLSITKSQFLELLHNKGVPYFDFTEDELAREFEAVDELEAALGKENGSNSR